LYDFVPHFQALGIVGSVLALVTLGVRLYWRYRMDQQQQEHTRMLEKQRQDTAFVLSTLGVPVVLNADGSIEIRGPTSMESSRTLMEETVTQLQKYGESELQRDGPSGSSP
jgi:hypothetical protein